MTAEERKQKSKEVIAKLDAQLEEIKLRSGHKHVFNSFMHDIIADLRKGERAICFYKYQFDELVKYFGDSLIFRYDKTNEWWECRLGYSKDDQEDDELVKDMDDRQSLQVLFNADEAYGKNENLSRDLLTLINDLKLNHRALIKYIKTHVAEIREYEEVLYENKNEINK